LAEISVYLLQPVPGARAQLRQKSVFEVDLVQAATDFRGAEAAMASKRTDGSYLAGASPASDRLGVDPEERCDFGGREERVSRLLLGHGRVTS
jgi:hypothetical protein